MPSDTKPQNAAERAKPAASDEQWADIVVDRFLSPHANDALKYKLRNLVAAALAEARRPLEDALREIAGDWTGNKKRREIARRALGEDTP